MTLVRQPAVAGQFYPADPRELAALAARLTTADLPPLPAFGAMLPHAGYLYSGMIAGLTLSRIAIPSTVILIGPDHHGAGAPLALWPEGAWQTPLGLVKIDSDYAAALQKRMPLIASDPAAHRFEHSLEVQLPLLQQLRPDLRIVPLLLNRPGFDELLRLGETLAEVVGQSPERPLIIASSDMTHYESAAVAARKDAQALEQVLAGSPEGLYRTVRDLRISMCGVLPTVALLAAARAADACEIVLTRYGHSGEVSGNDREVVGYSGVIIRS